MDWQLCYQTISFLMLISTTFSYNAPTLNCSDQKYSSPQDLGKLLSDTLHDGEVLLYTTEPLEFSDRCKNILTINNGIEVLLNISLASYCVEYLICSFKCGSAKNKWLFVNAPIQRTLEYSMHFNESTYTASVQEMTKGSTFVKLNKVLNVVVENCQGPAFIEYTRNYKLLKDDKVPFKWSAETQSNSLHVDGLIDYETNRSFNLTMRASLKTPQNKMLNATATTNIVIRVEDIDDNKPEFNIAQTEVYTLNITEHANISYINTTLVTSPPIHAYDPDFGINMNISYSIKEQNVLGMFTIGENTGFIMLTTELDYETQSIYRVIIQAAQDDRPDTATSLATLMVTVLDTDDHLPEFLPKKYECSIVEHSISGTIICTVVATDLDTTPENSNFTYIMWDDQNLVSVNCKGEITVSNSAGLDRESLENGTLFIKVGTETQAGSHGGNATVRITVLDINDNNPEFVKSAYTFSVEDVTTGSVVGQVIATDKDAGENSELSYTLLPPVSSSSCVGSSSNLLQFAVNSSTGDISVSSEMFCAEYVFGLRTCDHGVSRRCNVTTVTISHTRSSKVLNLTQHVSVLEELPNNTYIEIIQCSGEGHQYVYHGGPELTVDQNTGMIVSRMRMDREANDAYDFIVEVKMFNKLLCIVNVSVAVMDINDNAPSFTNVPYQFILPVHPKDGDFVGQITSKDADVDVNGKVSYFMENVRNSVFTLGESSGNLTIREAALLNDGVMQAYVIAEDSGIPPRRTSTIVYITGHTSSNMVPISTPLTTEQITRRQAEIVREISRILNITVDISKIEEAQNKTAQYKSRVHITIAQNSMVSRQRFLSEVMNHYEDIRSLFYQQDAPSGAGKISDSGFGVPEIGLLAMAGVILVGTIIAIAIVHRQFDRIVQDIEDTPIAESIPDPSTCPVCSTDTCHKRYKQLYETLTKNSSLYESQEIRVNIDDDGSECNGCVQHPDVNQDDLTESPNLAVSALNPTYTADTPLTSLSAADGTQIHETESAENQFDNTEVKAVLQQLSDSYEQEENELRPNETNNNLSGEGLDGHTSQVVYANVNTKEDRGSIDDANNNIVYANVEMTAKQEEESTNNEELIKFANDILEGIKETATHDDSITEEPNPDYDVKQVRFHPEVLDADENKLEPLKIDVVEGEQVDAVNNDDTKTNNGDDVNETEEVNDIVTTEPDSDTPHFNAVEDDMNNYHPSIEDQPDRAEEELESPEILVPYIEYNQDVFYFGNMDSTHF